MADKILTAVNKQTGARVKFHWTGTGSPKKEDLDQIFAEQHERAKAAVNKAGEDFDAAHPGSTEVSPLADIGGRALRGFSQAYGIDPLNPPVAPPTEGKSLYQRFKEGLPPVSHMILGPAAMIPDVARGAVEQGKGLYNDIQSGNFAGAVGRGLGLGSQVAIGKAAGGPEPLPVEPPTVSEPPMAAPVPKAPRPIAGPTNGIPKAPIPPIIDAEFTDIPQGQLNAPPTSLPSRQVAAPQPVRQLQSADTSPNFFQGGNSVSPPATVEAPQAPVVPQAPPAATVVPENIPPDPWLVKPPAAEVNEANIPPESPEPPMAGPVKSPIKPPQGPPIGEAEPIKGTPETELVLPKSKGVQRSIRQNKAGQLETLENTPISDISPQEGNVIYPEGVQKYIDNPPSLEEAPQLKQTPEGETPNEVFEGHHRITAAARQGAEEIPAWIQHPEAPEVPETSEAAPAAYDKIDSYFNNLKAVEGNTKPTPILNELSQQAKDLGFSPDKFEQDLREYGVSEPDIDKMLSQTYGKDLLASQAEDTRGPISQMAHNLMNDTSGELQLQKKNWIPKFPEMMKNQTGLLSRPMRMAHGMLSSTDQFLDTNPVTKPIADAARAAYFGPQGEQAFKSDVLSRFNEIHRSLNPSQLKELHDVMEGAPTEDPVVKSAAGKERALFDWIHNFAQSKGVTKASGKPMNYMSDYLTHIMKDDTFGGVATDYLKHLFGEGPKPGLKDRLMGEENVPLKAGQGTDLNQSLKTPRTQFAESRYGTEKPLESDMDTIARRYTESVGRAAFRGPVVKQAAEIIDKMPAGPDKHFAEYYVQKYGGLKPDSPLTAIDKGLARMSARSLLAFSPKLQMLHAIRLVGQGVPELGFKNVAAGAHEVLSNPNAAFTRAQRYGLIDNVPNKMKSGMEAFDKIGNFADLGNNFTKVIMHEGNRAKLKGTSPDWETKAAQETSRQEGMVNPTSPNYLLDKLPRLVSQYKNYGQKYLENVVRSALQQDKAGFVKLGRYVGSGVALYELSKHTGYALMHLRGRSILSLSTPQLETLQALGKHLTSLSQEDSNGKTGLDKAVMDILRFATPGGHEFTRKDSEGDLEFKPPSLSDESEKVEAPIY